MIQLRVQIEENIEHRPETKTETSKKPLPCCLKTSDIHKLIRIWKTTPRLNTSQHLCSPSTKKPVDKEEKAQHSEPPLTRQRNRFTKFNNYTPYIQEERQGGAAPNGGDEHRHQSSWSVVDGYFIAKVAERRVLFLAMIMGIL